MDMAVVVDIEPEVDAFVDGESCNESMLVVDMCAEGADAVGGENMVLHKRDFIYFSVAKIRNILKMAKFLGVFLLFSEKWPNFVGGKRGVLLEKDVKRIVLFFGAKKRTKRNIHPTKP